MAYIYSGILLSLKKEGNSAFCPTWMNLEGIMYAMWNKPGRERQVLHGITYMWNHKRKNVNLWKKRVEKWLPGADMGAHGYRERLIKAYKLLVIRWIRSEGLTYNMLTIVKNTILYHRSLLRP